jgi:hypothetical protein
MAPKNYASIYRMSSNRVLVPTKSYTTRTILSPNSLKWIAFVYAMTLNKVRIHCEESEVLPDEP